METFSKRLQVLKEEQHLSEKELSQITGISQPTLNRLLNGSTAHLQRKTLRALARFFNVSLNETISSNSTNSNAMKSTSTTIIPVFEWENVNSQLNFLKDNNTDNFQHIHIMTKMEGQIFALIVKDHSLEPRFPCSSNLIFKPNVPFKNRDYVITEVNNELVVKQFLTDGNSKYLKSLVSELNYPISQWNPKEKIIAVLIQAIVNYMELA